MSSLHFPAFDGLHLSWTEKARFSWARLHGAPRQALAVNGAFFQYLHMERQRK